MISNNPLYVEKSIEALANALNGSYEFGTYEQQIQRIADSHFTIIRYERGDFKSGSNELKISVERLINSWLITSDGWVITAYHTIKKYEKEFKKFAEKIRNHEVDPFNYDLLAESQGVLAISRNNKVHAIDFTEIHNHKNNDLVLIKIITESEPCAIPYCTYGEIEIGDQVQLLAYYFKGNKIMPYQKTGKILVTSYDTRIEVAQGLFCAEDVFITDIPGFRGLSGGLITTLEGQLVGLCIGGQGIGDTNQTVLGVKIQYAKNLINNVVKKSRDLLI